MSAIIVACEQGNLALVKVLLTDDNKNAFMRAPRDLKYRTPLMSAAKFEHFQVVQYLIEQGVDPDIAGSDGANALHWAAGWNSTNTELIELLLAHMTLDSINKKDGDGETPLDWAYYHNRSPLRQAITALIRSAGGKANYYNANGEYVGKGNGDLNTTDNNNNSKRPREGGSNDGGSNKKMKQMDLLEAAKSGDSDRVKELLKNGADPNQADSLGVTPLYVEVKKARPDIQLVKLLLGAGAGPNQADSLGQTPLHWAVVKGYTEICKLLLENGADPNIAETEYGYTPLHLAVMYAFIDIVKMLIAKGANVNAQDNSNRGALEFALSNSYYNFEKVTVLLDAGADKNQLPDVMRNKLEQLLNSQEMIPKERTAVATCPICLDPLGNEENGPAIRTACGHIFHRDCLRRAINVQSNLGQPPVCPTCRERIVIGVDDMGKAIKQADGITFRFCAMGLKF
jgi:ankyrin repeat protein